MGLQAFSRKKEIQLQMKIERQCAKNPQSSTKLTNICNILTPKNENFLLCIFVVPCRIYQ